MHDQLKMLVACKVPTGGFNASGRMPILRQGIWLVVHKAQAARLCSGLRTPNTMVPEFEQQLPAELDWTVPSTAPPAQGAFSSNSVHLLMQHNAPACPHLEHRPAPTGARRRLGSSALSAVGRCTCH